MRKGRGREEMEERDKGVQIRDHPSNNYRMGAPPL